MSETMSESLGFSFQQWLQLRFGRSQVGTVVQCEGQFCITKNWLSQIPLEETLVGHPRFQSHSMLAPHASSPPWLPSVLLLTRKPRIIIPPEHIWNVMFKKMSSQCVSYSGLFCVPLSVRHHAPFQRQQASLRQLLHGRCGAATWTFCQTTLVPLS